MTTTEVPPSSHPLGLLLPGKERGTASKASFPFPSVLHHEHLPYSYSTQLHPKRPSQTTPPRLRKTDHCLETIRLSVPDLTPLELYWESQEGSQWEVAAKADSRRECVRWDPLIEWMASRHYNLNDLALGSELEITGTV